MWLKVGELSRQHLDNGFEITPRHRRKPAQHPKRNKTTEISCIKQGNCSSVPSLQRPLKEVKLESSEPSARSVEYYCRGSALNRLARYKQLERERKEEKEGMELLLSLFSISTTENLLKRHAQAETWKAKQLRDLSGQHKHKRRNRNRNEDHAGFTEKDNSPEISIAFLQPAEADRFQMHRAGFPDPMSRILNTWRRKPPGPPPLPYLEPLPKVVPSILSQNSSHH